MSVQLLSNATFKKFLIVRSQPSLDSHRGQIPMSEQKQKTMPGVSVSYAGSGQSITSNAMVCEPCSSAFGSFVESSICCSSRHRHRARVER